MNGIANQIIALRIEHEEVVSLLCKIIGAREGFAAVWAGVWAFLGMGPHVPTRPS